MKPLLDWQNPEIVDIYDEVNLWSAPFGLLLLEQLPMQPGLTIVDVGFGTGFPLIELAQRFGPTALRGQFASHDLAGANDWLRQQLWYSTAAYTEYLKQFWWNNFGDFADFSPNYIVSNVSSIIRCLRGGTGLAVVPDFLCRESIAAGGIQLVWEGHRPLENTVYFG